MNTHKKQIQHFDMNVNGRDFIVGDCHGYFDVLRKVLNKVGFDETTDRLFSLGDLVDRGPQSAEVLEWLKKPWFHAILGNHERMMYEYYNLVDWNGSYASHGGQWFMNLPKYEQVDYVDILSKLPNVFEIETINGRVGMVHGEVPVNDWLEFKHNFDKYEERSLWSFEFYNAVMAQKIEPGTIQYIDHVVHGHTSVDKPTLLGGNRYYIDTGYMTKKLTLMEINNPKGFRYYQ